MSQLDDYSQRLAHAIFSAFPDWGQFSSGDQAFLKIEVPAPVQGPANIEQDFLMIDSDDGGITICFDRFHTHFNWFAGLSEREEFAKAIEFIRTLIKEEICVVETMKGERGCGGTLIEPSEEPDLSRFKDFDWAYVRSWNGTHNRIIKPDQKA